MQFCGHGRRCDHAATVGVSCLELSASGLHNSQDFVDIDSPRNDCVSFIYLVDGSADRCRAFACFDSVWECDHHFHFQRLKTRLSTTLLMWVSLCWLLAGLPRVLLSCLLSAAVCTCGSTHSFELRSFPGLGFQQCIFDGLCDLGGLPACLASALVNQLTGNQLQV